MKRKNILILGLLLIISFNSCGPNKQEIQDRKKFIADSLLIKKQDSLMVVKKDSIDRLEKEKQRIHLEKIEVGKSIKRTKIEKILDALNSTIIDEKRKLDQVNNFQIGRSASTKQQQLSSQKRKINELEGFISKIEKEIALTNLFNSFDFQLTPKGTVKHIFESAKSDDFSKMRHLLDPYGEYDSDVEQICFVEMLPSKIQFEWKEKFANGRIMSEPVINKNIARIEIAIGLASNKLETIELIKRQKKWYLLSM